MSTGKDVALKLRPLNADVALARYWRDASKVRQMERGEAASVLLVPARELKQIAEAVLLAAERADEELAKP